MRIWFIKKNEMYRKSILLSPHLLMLKALRKLASGRFWFVKVGLLTCLLSILAHTPFYEHLAEVPKQWGVQTKAWQVLHPFTPLNLDQFANPSAPYYEGTRSHLDKIGLRLTIPILGHFLGLGGYTFLVLSHVAGLAFFSLAPVVLGRHAASRITGILLSMGLSVTPFGAHFFTDQNFGDGVAWFFLLAAVALKKPVPAIIAVIAACFTDERAALAIPMAVLVRHIQTVPFSKLNLRDLILERKTWALPAGLVLYLLLRATLKHSYGLSTGSTMLFGSDIIISNYFSSPNNILAVFEGVWCLAACASFLLLTKSSWQFAILVITAFAMITGAAFAVWDFTRSIGYTFLIFNISACALKSLPFSNRLLIASLCFWASLLWYSPSNICFRIFAAIF